MHMKSSETRHKPFWLTLLVVLLSGLSPGVDWEVHAQAEPYMEYTKSVALLIGVGKYKYETEWKTLKQVTKDIKKLEKNLADESKRRFPFEVWKQINPKRESVITSIDKAMEIDYGKNGRLLIYLSGHGWDFRLKDEGGGSVFIGSDEPPPEKVKDGIYTVQDKSQALAFTEIVGRILRSTYDRQNDMKRPMHVAVIINTCVAGNVFHEMSFHEMSFEIEAVSKLDDHDRKRVVVIMTAGKEGQDVPDTGTYVERFLKTINTLREDPLPIMAVAAELVLAYEDKPVDLIGGEGRIRPSHRRIRLEEHRMSEFVFWPPPRKINDMDEGRASSRKSSQKDGSRGF